MEVTVAGTRSTPKLYSYQGRQWPLRDLAEAHGMDVGTLRSRLYRGLSLEAALARPVGPANNPRRKQAPHHKTAKRLLGNTYGELTVVGYETGPGWKWKCRCSCGAAVLRGQSDMLQVARNSVGASCSTAQHRGGLPPFETMPEYSVWGSMRARCNNPNNKRYPRYGGRGIKVCSRWNEPYNGFLRFVRDMGRRPSPELTIERVDNDGDYEPDNCEWASRKQQARNRATNRHLTIDGETRTLAEWSELHGIHSATISNRLVRGWPPRVAVSAPPMSPREMQQLSAAVRREKRKRGET